MSRLIDADKLMMSLNDNFLANSPTGNETLQVKDYRESVCEGLEIAMATVEGAPTASGWISVKDRLPDQAGFKCLVRGVNVFDRAFVFTAFTGYGDLNWYTEEMTYMSLMKGPYDNRVSDSWTITHWMPLPEPPEEREESRDE